MVKLYRNINNYHTYYENIMHHVFSNNISFFYITTSVFTSLLTQHDIIKSHIMTLHKHISSHFDAHNMTAHSADSCVLPVHIYKTFNVYVKS